MNSYVMSLADLGGSGSRSSGASLMSSAFLSNSYIISICSLNLKQMTDIVKRKYLGIEPDISVLNKIYIYINI